MNYIHPKQHSHVPSYDLPYAGSSTEINLAVVENHIEPGNAVSDAIATERMHLLELPVYPGNKSSAARMSLEASIRLVNPELSDEHSILLTHGSDSALRAILDSFADHDNPPLVTYAAPTYPHFLTFLAQHAGALRADPVDVGREQDILECLALHLSNNANHGVENGPGMVYLVSPSLPCGHVIDMERLKNLAVNHPQTLFVIDEAYFEYQIIRQTAIGLAPNVLVTRTFSKAYALASIRIGWMCGGHALMKVVDASINQKDVTDYACRLAKAALDDIGYYTQCAAAVMTESRQKLAGIPGVSFGQGGNFGLLKMQPGDPSAAEFVSMLRSVGFLTRDKSSEIPDTIRFTVPPPSVALGLASAINAVRVANRAS